MTQENDPPQVDPTPAPEPAESENILLNWVLVIVGLGAICLLGAYLPDSF